ncbi:hypothetical protein TG4357_00100 [Thalassovita gelatinovora]|uniref:Glycosyl transferase family 2 n=1 Tax=Thalassovita gelatinovora TaxID=53501 RepID=A0A0P1F3Z5_THAGE|nr:hypothetical protein [Thalassovita gelatinovora]QIZ79246.1 hypothetical protein HFZ77_01555 [Thalassovita gelatinovora]CUH62430.1 hypothetical protein TG4357_00100 [Thalassovita gelatinovora]SER17785.1 hypothetical protein SAMN04488043_1192 [Thalassovita gelatinovora]
MKLAFVTMVWRDYWLLEKWVNHNTQYVEKRNLYVINHGGDPKVHEIAAGCNVIDIPRDEVPMDLTRRRWDLLGGLTNGLLAFYDRVICTDVDELIVYVGQLESLQAHLETSTADTVALSPIGLNLIPREEGNIEDGVLRAYPYAMLSAKYTKPCIVRDRVFYTIGGHGLQRGQFTIDPDLLLFHLHYVTPDYVDRMEERRQIVLQSREHNQALEQPKELGKRYWINWAKPHTIRDKEFGIYERASDMPVDQGFELAAEALRAAVRTSGKKVVVDHASMLETPYRITIPEQMRDLL